MNVIDKLRIVISAKRSIKAALLLKKVKALISIKLINKNISLIIINLLNNEDY